MLTPKQKQIFEYIKKYIKKKGYSPTQKEIGKHFGLVKSTIHQHIEALKEKGYLNNQARAIEIIKNKKPSILINIPLLGTIAAGEPIEALEDKEIIKVPKSQLSRSGEHYALRVSGNSMIDEGIYDGDKVIIRKQPTVENGEVAVALINGNEVTLKKIYKEKNRFRLQPANPSLKPIFTKELIIQGKVVSIIRSFEELKKIAEAPQKIEKYSKLPTNRIICGDAVNIMEKMPDYSIDLTVTSPPYDKLRNYNGYRFNFEGIAKNLFRVTKKGGILVWVVGDKIKNGDRSLTSFNQAIFFQKIGFNVHDIMIYKKKNTPFMRTNAYTNCFEFMFVLSKGKPKVFNSLKVRTARQGQEMLPFNKGPDGINKKILGELKPEKTMTNIWEYAVGLHGTTSDKIAFEHPAVFPEKLAEDHILSWTNQGDIVFDPMCGSGTTCKMAIKNNRFYIGCDISKEYVELTKERLKILNFNRSVQ